MSLVPAQQVERLLLLNMLQPTSVSSKSEEYRVPALEAYRARRADGWVLCMVSDMYFPSSEVVAGHILRQGWGSALTVSCPLKSHGCNIGGPVLR
jgi:hypothetical protein